VSTNFSFIGADEKEVLAHAESHGWETKYIEEIAKRLVNLLKVNKKRDRVAIITQGTLPTIVAVSGKEISEYPVCEISKSKISDTNNGAGDTFAGGFVEGSCGR